MPGFVFHFREKQIEAKQCQKTHTFICRRIFSRLCNCFFLLELYQRHCRCRFSNSLGPRWKVFLFYKCLSLFILRIEFYCGTAISGQAMKPHSQAPTQIKTYESPPYKAKRNSDFFVLACVFYSLVFPTKFSQQCEINY